jgi:4-carboxymuconolactone decarboxylase
LKEIRMSSSRIPLPDLDHLTDEQQRVADAVASGPRGGVRGPLRMWLYSPELADRAQKLGEFLRWGTVLEPRIAELVILVTCRHYTCHYMWFNHAGFALKGGLSQQIIDQIKNRQEPAFDKRDEAVAYAFATEVLRNNAVSDSTLDDVRGLFGARGAVELSALIAHYHSGSIVLSLSDVELPDGTKTCLPL